MDEVILEKLDNFFWKVLYCGSISDIFSLIFSFSHTQITIILRDEVDDQ